MKSFILLLFFGCLLTIGPSEPSSKKGDVIYWTPETVLVWKDFKSRPDESLRFDALSHCGLEMDMTQENPDELIFNVRATFEPLESWVKGGESTDYLLSHEQLHFDIYERYARELRRRLQEFTYGDMSTLADEVSVMYDQVNQLIYDTQSAYDRETGHSHDIDQQREWEEKIKNELEELEGFEETRFVVKLSD